MTNEAVNPIELHGDNKGGVVRYTCSDTNAIAKGALLFLVDPRTVSGAALVAHQNRPAGIASTEKVAADGQTTIGVWTEGIFDLITDSDVSIIAGDLLVISGANYVDKANAISDVVSGMVMARSLEDHTAGTAETIACKLVMI